MRPSLRPVASGFVVFGVFAGAFAVAAIDIERSFHLSDAGLGLLQGAGILAGVVSTVWGYATTVYMPRVMTSYSERYGLFGVTIRTARVLSDIAVARLARSIDHDPW